MLNTIFFIALRQLSGRKRQTILTILGISIGSMVLLVTLGIAAGLGVMVSEKLIEVSAQITIKGEKVQYPNSIDLLGNDSTRIRLDALSVKSVPRERIEIRPYLQVLDNVDRIPLIDDASPFVIARTIAQRGTLSRPIETRGIIPKREAGIGSFVNFLKGGTIEELSASSDAIILGEGIARRIKAHLGDIIQVISSSGAIFNLKIVAFYRSGLASVDDNRAFVNLRIAQTMEGMPINSVSGIGIHTKDLERLNEVKEAIMSRTGYKAETWEETNANLISFSRTQRYTTFILSVFTFIVAGFGISTVLVTIVLQKRRDIAVMKSFGFSRTSISKIFILEGVMLGIIGTIVGIILGYYAATAVKAIRFEPNQAGLIRNDRINVILSATSYILVISFSILMAIVASIGPARRASKLKPVDILRGQT